MSSSGHAVPGPFARPAFASEHGFSLGSMRRKNGHAGRKTTSCHLMLDNNVFKWLSNRIACGRSASANTCLERSRVRECVADDPYLNLSTLQFLRSFHPGLKLGMCRVPQPLSQAIFHDKPPHVAIYSHTHSLSLSFARAVMQGFPPLFFFSLSLSLSFSLCIALTFLEPLLARTIFCLHRYTRTRRLDSMQCRLRL